MGFLGSAVKSPDFLFWWIPVMKGLLWWLVSFPWQVSTRANVRQLWQYRSKAFWSPGLCSKESSKYDVRQTDRALVYQNLMSHPRFLAGADPLRPWAEPEQLHVPTSWSAPPEVGRNPRWGGGGVHHFWECVITATEKGTWGLSDVPLNYSNSDNSLEIVFSTYFAFCLS